MKKLLIVNIGGGKMDKLLIKKTSILFFVIGLIVLVYEIIGVLFFIQDKFIYILTIIFLVVSLIFIFYGIKKQNKIVQTLHIIITYIVAFLSLLSSFGNMAGLIFIVINFILLDEYGFLKNKIFKWSIIASYMVCLILSIIFSKNTVFDFFTIAILFSFFFCFIKMYLDIKQTEDSKNLKEALDIIKEITRDNRELLDIAKTQLLDNQKRINILKEQSSKLCQFIDTN